MIIKDTCLGNRQIRVLSNGGCEVQNEQGRNPVKFESLDAAIRGIVKMRLAEIDATVPLGVFMQLEQAYITEITQAMQAIIPKEDNRKTVVDESQDEVPSEPYAKESINSVSQMSVVKDNEKEGEVNELDAATSTKD